MQGRRDSYLLHSLSNRVPLPEELAVNKLAVVFYDNKSPILYTKDFLGNILEVGKGASSLIDLKDVDLTNAGEGSFFIRRGEKFVASNTIGSITSLVDVEITAPEDYQYLRYNPILEAYSNYFPSYYLSQLSNLDVADPFNEAEGLAQANQVLYYDHPTRTYKTRPRFNRINELVDVEIVPTNDSYQILALDITDGIWKNSDLKIEYDPAPRLGNHLNASGLQIRNSSYRVNTVQCTLPTVEVNYSGGDYWILQGFPKELINQCIVNINLSTASNSTSVLMLEIRQGTGAILLGNLTNVKYEDGKPLKLSGAGKTDLITITQVNSQPVGSTNGIVTTYVTIAALNLATQGDGGIQSWRYDKNRYPWVQQFSTLNRYDDYFDYVESLLTFESELSTGKTWIEDKAIRVDNAGTLLPTTVSTTGVNMQTQRYLLGIPDGILQLRKGLSTETLPLANQANNHQYVLTTPYNDIVLDTDFTIEFYFNYPDGYFKEATTSSANIHYLFNNQTSLASNHLSLSYIPFWSSTSQLTELVLQVGGAVIALPNAYTYFANKSDEFYTHICIQRRSGQVELYVDGIQQVLANPVTTNYTFTVSGYVVAAALNLSALRITNKLARYLPNLTTTPSIRFGLVGGANDILDRQVFSTYSWLDRDLEHDIFCS